MIQPVILKEGTYKEQDVEDLYNSNHIWQKHDIYTQQLAELFEITHPASVYTPDFEKIKQGFIIDKTKDNPMTRGDWIYFPWNGWLIHSVAEPEYFALRTNRNRNLITNEEQQQLYNACIGVVGLSVGNSIAVGFAYHGIGQSMKLSEFDTLETTNLNRVRAGLHHIGTPKSEIATQQIYEINPYAQLLLVDRLTTDSLKKFFTGHPAPHVVFDEMDDFEIKIRLRLEARKNGIPIIMLTNLADSLLIDVERYDQNADLPLFNGRIGNTPEDILANDHISEADKHKYAVEIVGKDNLPQRALESVKEIGTTLVGRPQLSSTVAVCGGVASYLVRQLVLHGSLSSGRRVVRFDDVFQNQ